MRLQNHLLAFCQMSCFSGQAIATNYSVYSADRSRGKLLEVMRLPVVMHTIRFAQSTTVALSVIVVCLVVGTG